MAKQERIAVGQRLRQQRNRLGHTGNNRRTGGKGPTVLFAARQSRA